MTLYSQKIFVLVDLPQIAYIHVAINGKEIPIQAARRNDDTFLLKFRPLIAGDYSIILKDYIEQFIPGTYYKIIVH